MIEVSEQTIDRIHTILAGVENADKKVLKPALTRGLMAGKTAAGKKVTETYHISKAEVSSKGYLRYNSVAQSGKGIIGSFEYAGRRIPLIKFNVTPAMPRNGVTPSAAVLKANALTEFNKENNVFVGKVGEHTGVFERMGGVYSSKRGDGKNKHTEKIRELFSPAVPQMVGNDTVMQTVEDRVNEVINQRIDHEIERLLSK